MRALPAGCTLGWLPMARKQEADPQLASAEFIDPIHTKAIAIINVKMHGT